MKTIKDISSEAIESFKNQLRGELVFPTDVNLYLSHLFLSHFHIHSGQSIHLT